MPSLGFLLVYWTGTEDVTLLSRSPVAKGVLSTTTNGPRVPPPPCLTHSCAPRPPRNQCSLETTAHRPQRAKRRGWATRTRATVRTHKTAHAHTVLQSIRCPIGKYVLASHACSEACTAPGPLAVTAHVSRTSNADQVKGGFSRVVTCNMRRATGWVFATK